MTRVGTPRRKRCDHATSLGYDSRSRRLQIELASEIGPNILIANVQGLAAVPAAVICNVCAERGGYGPNW